MPHESPLSFAVRSPGTADRAAAFCFAGLLLFHAATPLAEAQDEAIREVLSSRVEALRDAGRLDVRGTCIASIVVLPDFYERRAFCRAWGDARMIDQLARAISDAAADGLDPRHYHQTILDRLRREAAATASAHAGLLADHDPLLTDALVRLGYHLMFGKVDPERLDPHWTWSPPGRQPGRSRFADDGVVGEATCLDRRSLGRPGADTRPGDRT